ncbi:MAG: serine/threonine-protein kinase [Bryobacterales bacterium]
MSFRIGDKVGDYRIVGVVGSGGAGKVFRVEHSVTGRIEAMKVLLEGRSDETDGAGERFLKEIKLQASLDHPNIAAVHNAFWANDELVMIMELVAGLSLDRIIAEGRMPMGKVLRYAVQSLIALEYAHSRGITHRDIKPENIMVTPEGVLKLMDFGLAKDRNDNRNAEAGIVVGSLYYISPEQARGLESVDHRTDVYSFGSVLYEMTTGERPFQHGSSFDLLRAAVHENPEPPSELAPDIPPALETVILRAMSKDPAERFQSAREFRRTIEAIARNPGLDAVVPQASAQSSLKTRRRSMAIRSKARRQNGTRIALLGLSAVVLLYLGVRAFMGADGAEAARAVVGAPPSVEQPTRGSIAGGGFVLRETMRLEQPVASIAFSPTGKVLAAGLGDGRIRVWDTGSGRQLADLDGGPAGSRAMAVSPDGDRVVTIAADGSVLVWDVKGGAPRRLDALGPAHGVIFSNRGRRVAVSEDKAVRVVDLASNESWSFSAPKGPPKAMAFSPAGPMLVASEPGRIALWGVGLTDKREDLHAGGPEAETIAFSANGLELAAGIGQQVVTWDMPSRRAVRTYSLQGRVRALTPDGGQGWIAVSDGANSKQLRVWKVHEGRSMAKLPMQGPALAVALAASGDRIAASTAEGEVQYWDTLPPLH